MNSNQIYKKWDIVLVSFLQKSIKRPALVISPEHFNTDNDIIVVFITSKLSLTYQLGDYQIKEWESANLPKPSLIRMNFGTVNKTQIKILGRLSENDINEYDSIFSDFFKLEE